MTEFVGYLREVFERFGLVQARKMFGAYGLYHDGIMFGLIVDDTLYLKSDDTVAHFFETRGLRKFEYGRYGKIVKMSYYAAPEEIFDDREEAARWARRSFEVAFRTKRGSTRRLGK